MTIEISRGDGPVLLGLPHTGTEIPEPYLSRLNDAGRAIADTDWHIHVLFDGLLDGATTVRTRTHRYVVDVNRSSDNESLYPGQNTTGTCPLTDFDGHGIYLPGQDPDETDIATRLALFHAPYHDAMQAEIARIRDRHGIVILFDCHSIRSHIPYLFEGTLPVLNLGTNSGASCAPALQKAAWDIAEASPFDAVLNGRFKGGWTTRHYGRPETGVHALQMEIAQRAYLSEESPPWGYDPIKADALRGTLRQMLETLRDTAMEMPR